VGKERGREKEERRREKEKDKKKKEKRKKRGKGGKEKETPAGFAATVGSMRWLRRNATHAKKGEGFRNDLSLTMKIVLKIIFSA